MYNLDTGEEVDLDLFLNALENGEIIIDSRGMTEEEHAEVRRKMAELKAKRKEKELVLA